MGKEAEIGLPQVLRSGFGLLLIAVLVVGPAGRVAYADDHQRRPAGLSRSDRDTGPLMVGRVDSLAPIMINRRETQGSEVIWSGDLIELLTDASARLTPEFSAAIVLSRGAVVRLSTVPAGLHESGFVLIASLIDGDMVVDLRQGGEVFIEAGRSIITAAGEAHLRLRVQGGVEAVGGVSGKVTIQARPKRQLKSVVVDPAAPSLSAASVQSGRDKPLPLVGKAMARIERRRSNQAMLQTSLRRYRAGQSDIVDVPAPGRLLKFEVDPPTLGTCVPPSESTDQNGEIRFGFRAASVRSTTTGTIRARIADLNPAEETILEEQALTITVVKRSFWQRHRIKLLTAAAVIVTAIIIKETAGSGTPPLMKDGPPR